MNDIEFRAAEARTGQEAQLWALTHPREHAAYVDECDRRIEAWTRENTPHVVQPARTRENRRTATFTEAAPTSDREISEALLGYVLGDRATQLVREHTAPVVPAAMPELPEVTGPMSDAQLHAYALALPAVVLAGPLAREAAGKASASPFWASMAS